MDESPLHDFTLKHVVKLCKETEQEINRGDPAEACYLHCSALRKLTAVWTTLRTAFGDDITRMECNIKCMGNASVFNTVKRVKDAVKAMGRAGMNMEAEGHIVKC